MLPAFRLGVGGKLGTGEQYMSWVALEDAIRAIELAIRRDDMSGAYNVCSPNPVTNAEFTRTNPDHCTLLPSSPPVTNLSSNFPSPSLFPIILLGGMCFFCFCC